MTTKGVKANLTFITTTMIVVMMIMITKVRLSLWCKLQIKQFSARSQNKDKGLSRSSCLPFCLSVRMEQLRWDFHEILYFSFFFWKTCRENSSFIKNRTVITVTVRKDQYTFLIISRSALLRVRKL